MNLIFLLVGMFSAQSFADSVFKFETYVHNEQPDCTAAVDTFKRTMGLAFSGRILQVNATPWPAWKSCQVSFTYSAPAEIALHDYLIQMNEDACQSYAPNAMARITGAVGKVPMAGACGWLGYHALLFKSDVEAAPFFESAVYPAKAEPARLLQVARLAGGMDCEEAKAKQTTVVCRLAKGLPYLSRTWNEELTQNSRITSTSEYSSAAEIKAAKEACRLEANYFETAFLEIHPFGVSVRCYENPGYHGDIQYMFIAETLTGGTLPKKPKILPNTWMDWVPIAGNTVKSCQDGRAEMLQLYPTFRGKTARHALCLVKPGTGGELHYLMVGLD